MADNERPARVQEEIRWIREEMERTRAEARMRERAHEERRERQERQNQARAEELEAELQQQQWDFGRNVMRAMEQFRPRPVDPPVAIADNGVAAAAVGNEMAQRAAAAQPLPLLPPGIPPIPAVWYPAPQPTLPKPTIEPLDTTTPEAYIEFQRAYKIIMKSRDRWSQRQRKQFLLENVRKEAAILCTGVEYDIDNDEVTWETVLGRLENTFLTRNNTAQAGTEFRAAKQKKGEPITSWAARLRDLHLRAYARTHPDAEQRERHDELRSAFAKGLRDARVQLSLANQVSQVPTLLELVKIATDTEFHIAMSHPDSPVKGSVNEMEAEQTKQDQAEDGRLCTLCEKIGHKWPGCPELKKEVAQKFADASLKLRRGLAVQAESQWRLQRIEEAVIVIVVVIGHPVETRVRVEIDRPARIGGTKGPQKGGTRSAPWTARRRKRSNSCTMVAEGVSNVEILTRKLSAVIFR